MTEESKQVAVHPSQFTPDYMMNSIMMNQFGNTINKIMDATESLTLKKIGMLLMLCIGNELRPEIREGLKNLTAETKQVLIRLLSWVKKIAISIQSMKQWVYQPKAIMLGSEHSDSPAIANGSSQPKDITVKMIDVNFVDTLMKVVEWQQTQGMCANMTYLDSATIYYKGASQHNKTNYTLTDIYFEIPELGKIQVPYKFNVSYQDGWKTDKIERFEQNSVFMYICDDIHKPIPTNRLYMEILDECHGEKLEPYSLLSTIQRIVEQKTGRSMVPIDNYYRIPKCDYNITIHIANDFIKSDTNKTLMDVYTNTGVFTGVVKFRTDFIRSHAGLIYISALNKIQTLLLGDVDDLTYIRNDITEIYLDASDTKYSKFISIIYILRYIELNEITPSQMDAMLNFSTFIQHQIIVIPTIASNYFIIDLNHLSKNQYMQYVNKINNIIFNHKSCMKDIKTNTTQSQSNDLYTERFKEFIQGDTFETFRTLYEHEKLANYIKSLNVKKTKSELTFKIDTDKPIYETKQYFIDYFDTMKKKFNTDAMSAGQSNKNTIYTIKIDNEQKVEQDNPEHKDYLEKKEKLEELMKSENIQKLEKCGGEVVSEYMNLKPPPEKITTIQHDTNISINEIRTFCKPIDTLYLRKEDKTVLKNTLQNYRNNDIFERFGIPRKLGILAHGIPGTGKTSTILSIATYLNLDIYYVRLNEVKTCKELKKLFDKVSKENTKNGMIVLEDIDAMIDIVKKREYRSSSSLSVHSDHSGLSRDTEIQTYGSRSTTENQMEQTSLSSILSKEDEPITLEYLLNILDGTLCNENNIFVITTNHKESLDPALYRKGRIDVDIEFKKCDHYQMKEIISNIMEQDIADTLLDKIPEDTYTPAQIIFQCLEYYYNRDDIPLETVLEPFIL